jgi:hypothetical protein
MKSNASCHSFIEDIAAAAGGSAPLSAAAKAHLGECEQCQRKLAELKVVAVIYREAAAKLPQPELRLKTRRLVSALGKGTEPRRTFPIALRPVFTCAVAFIAIGTVLFVFRKPYETVDPEPIVRNERPERKVESGGLEPTLLAFRNELQSGREQVFASAPAGVALRHYRVKDVESELRN